MARMCALFSSEILQAGAVKGLIYLRRLAEGPLDEYVFGHFGLFNYKRWDIRAHQILIRRSVAETRPLF